VRECDEKAPAIANREEMLTRLDHFLTEAKISREACGSHYFTWNVFKIECDPDSVLDTVATINLGMIPLQEGAYYRVPATDTLVKLTRANSLRDGSQTFTGTATIDSEFLRKGALKTIEVVAQLSGEKLSKEAADARLKGFEFSGEVTVSVFSEPKDARITLEVLSEVREINAEGQTGTRRGKEVTKRQRVEAPADPDPLNSSSSG